jgi:hypothetical protein
LFIYTLGIAVSFLANALKQKQFAAVTEATKLKEVDAFYLEQLAEYDLPTLYAGRSFPGEGDEFKLGGHDKELGHIHIDFVRNGDGWEINNIWMCR